MFHWKYYVNIQQEFCASVIKNRKQHLLNLPRCRRAFRGSMRQLTGAKLSSMLSSGSRMHTHAIYTQTVSYILSSSSGCCSRFLSEYTKHLRVVQVRECSLVTEASLAKLRAKGVSIDVPNYNHYRNMINLQV